MSQTSFGVARLGEPHLMSWPAADTADAPRQRAGRRSLWIFAAAGLLGALSIAICLARHHAPDGAPAVEQASAPVPKPIWRDVPNPEHIYALELPGRPDLTRDYSARLHEAGGGREDRLALGALDGAKPVVRLRILRRAGGATGNGPDPTPLYAALVHEAAQAGLSVARSGLAEILPTRFGRFEVADLALRRSGEEAPLACSGFRLIRDEPGLSITGFACGAQAAPLNRSQVGCLIERLDVAAVGNDQALADFFAKAERNPACPAAETPPAQLLQDVAPNGKPATGRRRLPRR